MDDKKKKEIAPIQVLETANKILALIHKDYPKDDYYGQEQILFVALLAATNIKYLYTVLNGNL